MNRPRATRLHLPTLRLMIGCLPLLIPASAPADPIPNGSFAQQTVGWFDGSGRTCPEICREQGAVAEHEENTAPPAAQSYVCKVRKAESGPYWWLFGTQFADRPACYVTDRDLRGEYSEVYYCLCARARKSMRRGMVERVPSRSPDDGRE